METIEIIKSHYGFTPDDARKLARIKPVMEKYGDEFITEFYEYIKNFEEAYIFLKDSATIKRHQSALKMWFINLFGGNYGDQYLSGLNKVGMVHVRINLHAHYVNAAFHFVKLFCRKVLRKEITDKEECLDLEGPVEKILDINLDIFTSSYIEEEKKFFLSQKVESHLIQLVNRFAYGLNLILVFGLVILGLIVLGLFGYDLFQIRHGDVEKVALSILGTLLMFWLVIMLMRTEIRQLRGAKFSIKVFLNVAMVAVIRKILVSSVAQTNVEAQTALVVTVAVLGIVYWLVSKVET